LQACSKFDVMVEAIADDAGRYRVTILLSGEVRYREQQFYRMMLLAQVRQLQSLNTHARFGTVA